jgi:transcription elongation factor Elf1
MSEQWFDFECPSCWEAASVQFDLAGGAQDFKAQCEACSTPLLIHLTFDGESKPGVKVEPHRAK